MEMSGIAIMNNSSDTATGGGKSGLSLTQSGEGCTSSFKSDPQKSAFVTPINTGKYYAIYVIISPKVNTTF